VPGNVSGDIGRANPPSRKRRLLDVDGSDLGPLLVAEDRKIYRARNVVFGELARAADIDDVIKGFERLEIQMIQNFRHIRP